MKTRAMLLPKLPQEAIQCVLCIHEQQHHRRLQQAQSAGDFVKHEHKVKNKHASPSCSATVSICLNAYFASFLILVDIKCSGELPREPQKLPLSNLNQALSIRHYAALVYNDKCAVELCLVVAGKTWLLLFAVQECLLCQVGNLRLF